MESKKTELESKCFREESVVVSLSRIASVRQTAKKAFDRGEIGPQEYNRVMRALDRIEELGSQNVAGKAGIFI